MCLGIPGQVVELPAERPEIARVDVSGVVRDIGLGLMEDASIRPGDWILIHMGFALSKMEEHEARDALSTLTDLGQGTDEAVDRYDTGTPWDHEPEMHGPGLEVAR